MTPTWQVGNASLTLSWLLCRWLRRRIVVFVAAVAIACLQVLVFVVLRIIPSFITNVLVLVQVIIFIFIFIFIFILCILYINLDFSLP